jgi:hypothetical protein
MKIVHCHQGSGEWLNLHRGNVTGSCVKQVLDFTQKGLPGASRKTYFRTKLAELLTGEVVQDNYVSKEMLEGIEREPYARAAYEVETGQMVEEIGFAVHDTIPRFGGSVDGLVGDDGFIEIKCPKPGTYAQWFLDGVIPEEHLPQIDSYLLLTGRAWCDFVAWNGAMPKPMRTMIIRRYREEKAMEKIEAAVREFNESVDEAIAKLRSIVGDFLLPAALEERKDPPEHPLMAGAYLSDADFEAAIKGDI